MVNHFFPKGISQGLRLFIILINDILLINFALYISYFLRIEYFISLKLITNVSIISSLIYLFLFIFFRIYKQYFRYFNSYSYGLYLKFFFSYTFLFSIYVFFQNTEFIPRSLAAIFPSFFFGCLIFNRILVAKYFDHKHKINKNNAIVFGFNGSNINSLSSYAKILCFVDDNKINSKRRINGIRILTSKEFISEYKNLNFIQILIFNERIFNKSKNLIRDHIFKHKILVQKINYENNKILTSSYFDFNYFFNRENKVSPLGNIYNNKTILITGAGGSIGSNIVFQILKTKYKKLILLDNSEYNLYNLEKLIKEKKDIILKLKNFNEQSEIKNLFLLHNIDIIFHTAAYKHVPLIENNPFSAIKNNFLDTFYFMKLVSKYDIPYFCLISSDKAVRPTNIMGASKRLSELSMNYINNLNGNNTIFNAVRFGNVINSSGSVKPLFQSQIDNNLDITLTHKKIIRYFMTIEEAANLVLNTYKISKGGEIFLLDMGEPIKLLDLARTMIQFSGKTEKINGNGDIKIKIIGLREGEKLYEELLIDNESITSEIKNIFQSIERKPSQKEFIGLLKKVQIIYNTGDSSSLYKTLKNEKLINYKSNND